MKYPHSLNPDDYTDTARTVLSGMLKDSYPSDNIAEVQCAISSLQTRRKSIAKKSKLKFKHPDCLAILEAMYMVARLWSDLWAARGASIFEEKLRHYWAKNQSPRAKAIDQLLYDALEAKRNDIQPR